MTFSHIRTITLCFAMLVMVAGIGLAGECIIITPEQERAEVMKLIPENKGSNVSTSYPADQAYKCILKFFSAFNKKDKASIKTCFTKDYMGVEMAQKSTGEWWRRTAAEPSVSEIFRSEARKTLRYIAVHGMPKMPAGNSTIVIVDRNGKTAKVLVEDFKDTAVSSTPFVMVYRLRRINGKAFLIDDMEATGNVNFLGGCRGALESSVPGNYKYARHFMNATKVGPSK